MTESTDPLYYFRTRYYFQLNERRLEHLASLGLPIAGRRVMEVGAGIGDHTPFFLDRDCSVLITDARDDNLAVAAETFRDDARVRTRRLDLDDPPEWDGGNVDLVYFFGLLYHLVHPDEAIAYVSAIADRMVLLETVCGLGDHEAVNHVDESVTRCSQSMRGTGCRPTRPWVMAQMRRHFDHVYTTRTQPWHEEFPLMWPDKREELLLGRAIFIASSEPLNNPLLVEEPLKRLYRH